MSSDRVAKAFLVAIASTFVEQIILPKIGLGFLLEQGGFPPPFGKKTTLMEPSLPLAASFLPCGYGLVIMVVSITHLWVLMVGMSVGSARSKYSSLAEKDGEKNVPERYELPNLYAQGTSKHALAFNCVQRSHQQILETLPGYFCTVLFTGLEFPITAFVFASLWLYSRIVWVRGYSASNGDPSKRYSHPFSGFFWQCKLVLLMASWFVAIELLLGRKIFWDQLLPSSLFE